MSYILSHTTLGFCWWDLLALVILVGVCVYAWKKIKKMKDQLEDLQERAEGVEAASAVQMADNK